MDARKTDKRTYFDWFMLSLFFGYQYLLRSCPGIFTNEIREHEHAFVHITQNVTLMLHNLFKEVSKH